MFCPKCGQEVSDNANFCKYCGEPLSQTSESHASLKKININASNAGNRKETTNRRNRSIKVLIAVVAVVVFVGALIIYQEYDNKKVNEGIYLLSKLDASEEAKENDFLPIPLWDNKGLILSKTEHPEQLSFYLNTQSNTFNFSPSAVSTQLAIDDDGVLATGTYEYNPETKEMVFYSDNGAIIYATYYASKITIEIEDTTMEFQHSDTIPIYPDE